MNDEKKPYSAAGAAFSQGFINRGDARAANRAKSYGNPSDIRASVQDENKDKNKPKKSFWFGMN